MPQGIVVQKSLVEQILDNMFASIAQKEEFDVDTIRRLKKLAERGDLKKAPRVAEAVKSMLRDVQ